MIVCSEPSSPTSRSPPIDLPLPRRRSETILSSCGLLIYTVRGVFIGVNGTSTDLERSIRRLVVAGQPSHMASRSGGAASIDLGFSSSCRRMATKALAKPPQTLAGRPLCPLNLGSGPLGPRVKYTPPGDDDFVIWFTSLCCPLKCSDLVPKFLKSNNTRIVELG
jgi:hypothetical protein